MKNYEKSKIEILLFPMNDVLVTSGEGGGFESASDGLNEDITIDTF